MENENKYNKLTEEEERVILHKGTERPFTGKYNTHFENGIYPCKRCNAPLYKSEYKFKSHCGWPSFDDEIPGAIKRKTDSDGVRTEILCNNCDAHLGHVFTGEHLTDKNIRHCVNSISMNFIKTMQAIFAAGCFWGVEHLLQKQDGVVYTEVGYTGGKKANPTYHEVCYNNTGHAEAVRVYYTPEVVSFEELAKLFFEIHDPTQHNRQGPDIGEQYRSAIFYVNNEQKETAEKLINQLEDKGYNIATSLEQANDFWIAEEYHQNYYDKKNSQPYCHTYKKRF